MKDLARFVGGLCGEQFVDFLLTDWQYLMFGNKWMYFGILLRLLELALIYQISENQANSLINDA